MLVFLWTWHIFYDVSHVNFREHKCTVVQKASADRHWSSGGPPFNFDLTTPCKKTKWKTLPWAHAMETIKKMRNSHLFYMTVVIKKMCPWTLASKSKLRILIDCVTWFPEWTPMHVLSTCENQATYWCTKINSSCPFMSPLAMCHHHEECSLNLHGDLAPF